MWRPLALVLSASIGLSVATTPVVRAYADNQDDEQGRNGRDEGRHRHGVEDRVERFATLPAGQPGHPEGLTADRWGNIYAASFDAFGPNNIYVYDMRGRLRATTPVPIGQAPLGMVTIGNRLYVNDVLHGDVLRYRLPLTDASLPEFAYDVCGGFVVAFGTRDPDEFCALNAIDRGPDGRLYISDNGAGEAFVGPPGFNNGRIFVLDPVSGHSEVFFDGDAGALDVVGFPAFGVNGVAFSNDGKALYMANMSADTIFKLTVKHCALACEPGTFSLFAEGQGIDGPDNMDFDNEGILWVASGQNDQVVGINRKGKVVERIGSFRGFTSDGAPKGLLQPSGLVFSYGKLYVGNESSQGLRPATDPINWSKLKLFTIVRIDP